VLGLGRKNETRFWDSLAENDERTARQFLQQDPRLVEAPAPRRVLRRHPELGEGAMPVHGAAYLGEAELAEALLRCGAIVDAITSGEDTPLHFAAGEGHEAVVKVLLSHETNVDATNGLGQTPLHIAAEQGHERIAALLIKSAADASLADEGGNTALHSAGSGRCERTVRSLLERGVEVEVRNQRMRTPLHAAIIGADHSVYSRLDPQGRERRQVSERIVRRLLEKGADPNAVDNTGATALDLLNYLEGDIADDPLVKLLRAYGGHWVRYHHRHAEQAKAEAAAHPGGTLHSAPQPTPAPAAEEASGAAAAPGAGQAVEPGQTDRQPVGEPIPLGFHTVLIGRHAECDVRYRSRTMSRRHAQITPQHGEYVIEDLGSRNGVVINDHKLSGPHALSPGEIVTLGVYEFEFDGHNLIPLKEELSEEALKAETAK
jgi:hypothetical protein